MEYICVYSAPSPCKQFSIHSLKSLNFRRKISIEIMLTVLTNIIECQVPNSGSQIFGLY